MTATLRQKFRGLFESARPKAPDLFWDFAGFAGAASATYGVFLIYRPAGWILAGLFLIGFAVLFGPSRKIGEPGA